MQLVIYSQELAQEKHIGWHRGGEKISYFSNGIMRSLDKSNSLHTLRFSYKFEYDKDYVWFAYSYLYTYSQLVEFLNKIESIPATSEYYKTISRYMSRKTLCRTLLGNRCEYLVITSSKSTKKKRGVFITARVHPGETVGSWIMQGIHTK